MKRLDDLLPRLQGMAGEFFFGQLRKAIRGNYDTLIFELNSPFSVVETKKTYAAHFSKRNQKVGETTKEYAAELKRLYDRAYAHRDSGTRQEDLLRRFLDGLYDDKARFQVEYFKEPKTIDEAVFFVVDFEETRQKPVYSEGQDKKYKRLVRNVRFSESESKVSDDTSWTDIVTMQNGWNNRISNGCVYAQIRRGLGMHLVTYSNHDTVLFLLIVPIKGRFV